AGVLENRRGACATALSRGHDTHLPQLASQSARILALSSPHQSGHGGPWRRPQASWRPITTCLQRSNRDAVQIRNLLGTLSRSATCEVDEVDSVPSKLRIWTASLQRGGLLAELEDLLCVAFGLGSWVGGAADADDGARRFDDARGHGPA